MRIEAFLPSRHGFPCVLQSPDGEDFGLGTPRPGAFGLSAGAAWTALDHYLTGRPLPAMEQETLESGTVLDAVLRRQRDALARAGWHELRDWQSLPDRGVPGRPGLAERSRREFRRLREHLNDGIPVLLYVVLARGRHADPSDNVAVLAYDYELDRRARRASIRVYDPARPGNDNVRLVFHAGAGKALDARLAVQTPVRGFFCVPYDRPLPATLTLNAVSNEDARLVKLLAAHGNAVEHSFEALGVDRDGRLFHVRRRRSGGYATEHIDVDVPDGSDVEQAAFIGAGRTVLWTSKGELVDCRRRPGLGWAGRRITDTRTHGPFDGIATGVPRERGRVSLFACGTGRLMHFHRGRLPAWEAEHVDAGPLARAACVGRPAGVRLGSAMHVAVRTRTGELLHARWRPRGGWTAENVTARAGDRGRYLTADDPILLRDAGGRALAAVARSQNGSVLIFRWTERKGWRAFDLSAAVPASQRDTVRSDSTLDAAIEPDGTVHVVGRAADGGLLHAWSTRDGSVGVANLVHARPRIADRARIDFPPTIVAGPADGLHVLARRDADLLLFRWGYQADWAVENLTLERTYPRGTDGALLCADGGTAHVALLDREGRAHHVRITPRDPTARRLRVPARLLDVLLFPLTLTGVLADAVSALIGLSKRKKGAPVAARPSTAGVSTPARPHDVAVADALSRHVEETEAAPPLPLLDEPFPAQERTDATEGITHADTDSVATPTAGVDTTDDWSEAPPPEEHAVLDGPLDHLLGFGPAQSEEESAPIEEAPAEEVVMNASESTSPGGVGAAVRADDVTQQAGEAVGESVDGTEVHAEAADIDAFLVVDDVSSIQAEAEATPDAVLAETVAGDEATRDATDIESDAATRADASEVVTEAELDAVAADDIIADAAAQPIEATLPEVVPEAGRGEVASEDTSSPKSEQRNGRSGVTKTDDPATGDLIIVYPEPEKRSGKKKKRTARNGRGETAAAKKSDPAPAESAPPEDIEPLPLLDDGKPVVREQEPAEPWALPGFEVTSPTDDWNIAEDEPWSVTPIDGLESSPPPDIDDWSLPPVEGLEPFATGQQDDWNLPPLDVAEQAPASDPAPGVDATLQTGPDSADPPHVDDRRTPSIADTDDDWNLPDDAPAVVPEPIESPVAPSLDVSLAINEGGLVESDAHAVPDAKAEAREAGIEAPGEAHENLRSSEPDDRAAGGEDVPDPAIAANAAEEAVAAKAEPSASTASTEEQPPEPPRRRKWQNPALEGLPLLDDEDDDAPVASRPASPPPKQAPQPGRKKPKKTSANELERIIALAEANEPELLPPD